MPFPTTTNPWSCIHKLPLSLRLSPSIATTPRPSTALLKGNLARGSYPNPSQTLASLPTVQAAHMDPHGPQGPCRQWLLTIVACLGLCGRGASAARVGKSFATAHHASRDLLPQQPFLFGYNLGNLKLLPFEDAPYAHTAHELKAKLRHAFADMHNQGGTSPSVSLPLFYLCVACCVCICSLRGGVLMVLGI